jgi:hypothetical protein
MNPDFRPFRELDFICETFYEHMRDVGIAKAKLSRDVVIERGLADGLERLSLESAVAILVGAGHLGSEEDGRLALRLGGKRVPSEERKTWTHGQIPEESIRRDLFPVVRDIVARRTDGRPQAAEPLDAFTELLEPLGHGQFRLWWRQTVDELRRSDDTQNSVAVCVFAAAAVEGALTFVVKHGRSLGLGLFGSDDFDRPPANWKIDDLVKSAAFSGGKDAIFDQALKVRVDGLILTRQRIHAGRMLKDYPSGVPDLRPDDARDARRTAEVAVRRIIDWIQAHPGRPAAAS